jgi:hypothetical protein
MINAFRFWCQRVLPFVYDDSLSALEVLTKVVAKLNEVIESENTVSEATEKAVAELADLAAEFEKFKDGGFDEYYEEKLEEWTDKYAETVIKEVFKKQVYFGLTDDGYFCAYIPDSWGDITFDTGVIYGEPEYGRLELIY